MKIALVTATLFHQGAEFVIAALARGLSERGHQVDVLLSPLQDELQRAHPDWQAFETIDGVRMIRMSHKRARYCVGSIRRIIRENDYDVVMCHASPYALPLVLATRCLSKPPKIVYVEHLGGVGLDAQGNRVEPSHTVRAAVTNLLMRCYDRVFVVSRGTGDAFARMTGYPAKRICTVYNPVLDEVFERKVVQVACHPWLKEKSVQVVIAAGAFTSFKHHLDLIEAFARVVKRRACRLIIFGEGELRGAYERRITELGIGEAVSLPGFTNNLLAEMKAADCFVVSSVIESFSVVLVEALACGTPVVSTDAPYGPPEILDDGKYGVMVRRADVASLAQGIERVLDGRGIVPPTEAWQRFTVERVVQNYEQCMRF